MKETRQQENFDLLLKYGSRWAILTAMSMDLAKKGIPLQQKDTSVLDVARIEITSGCYSSCEIDCKLSTVEGLLIAAGSVLGEDYLDSWLDLLAEAMQGRFTYEQLIAIPAIQPIETSCGFLKCNC